MIGDLHCHTRLSDGSMSIDDLIFYAKRSGLDFVGVTDHDTMAGINRAEQLGKRLGIGVVGGVEISTRDYARNRRVHLLCYLPKHPDRLEGTLKKIVEGRDKAKRQSMRMIMRRYPVTEEHILRLAAGSSSLYQVHIMEALMELGYTGQIYGELYRQLLSKNGSCYVPVEYPDVWETAKLIRSAGGVCVLAHPSVYDSIELMEELAKKGTIDGIERDHPRVKQEHLPIIDQVLKEYGLISTGGTDFHGKYTKNPNPLGTCVTQQEGLERIFQLAKSR